SSEDEFGRGPAPATPEPFVVETTDRQPIRGCAWRHPGEASAERPVVIVNSATSVRCRYYSRFAAFLFANGMDVITFDYRGIGESRPTTLRGFEASWIDWGNLDFEAVLCHAARAYPGQPIHVVGHSAGGIMPGIAQSNHLIQRVLTVG